MKKITHSLKRVYYPIMGLLGLTLVIVAHEFGHFLAAKIYGVGTPIFSIGFGPALISIKLGQTIFQIAAIPLGGYVSMSPADLAAQPYLNKMVIILAGIVFNIIFAYLILVYLALRGKHTILPVAASIVPESPAQHGGLMPNDRIIACNHEPINQDFQQFLKTIAQSPGKKITLTVERQGLTQDIPITLGTDHPILGPHIGWLGVHWQTVKSSQPTIKQSLREGKKTIQTMMRNLGQFTATIFKQKRGPGITGPIGIIIMTGKSLALSPQYFALILAVVSINVAMFNILPIPFLDGGKAVQYTLETIIGPIPEGILNYITIFFLLLFLLLIISVTMGDIRRLRKK